MDIDSDVAYKFNELKFILHLDRRRSDDGELSIDILPGVVRRLAPLYDYLSSSIFLVLLGTTR